MKATEIQEQIAKELCLKIIDKGMIAYPHRGDLDEITFNTLVGTQVGALYQEILSSVSINEDN
ncbi:MAG: hypothetical protein ACLSH8_10740 [Zhenhengia sp.]|uniref:hypothetical protein n=1 Tax=Zhenhengia sp. TaxID=2944208 RepID=UPI003991D09E